ncbi:unnamed protein product (macronuclear) [Paramecium tetraurelia]|uniref:1-phosphatidylinositol 4-kinase n=1 Tax=Paramecium tetraurelia TaxID=5888 RepID=A0C4X5_PARTE|nr:uncharacterized protein GSPATT00006341001 [Paramecium tetraurelia]CAK65842.1 unnamed protein product [Paramecium tetraurelia]|eukprot:XP_001433239.1 hypothetical protein (macronuclear) [Paramecium tetraurelia strain d4-2]
MSKFKDQPTSSQIGCGCFGGSYQKTMTMFSHIEIDDEIVSAQVILEMIYRGQNALYALSRCKLNPNLVLLQFRDDLEYFIPQLINQILYKQLEYVLNFILKAAEVDFFFAHTFFFAWRSIVNDNSPEIENYLRLFLSTLDRVYKKTLLIAAYQENHQFNQGIEQQISKGMPIVQQTNILPDRIQAYGTLFYSTHVFDDTLHLANYESIFREAKSSGFCSNIDFWDDIIYISQNLHLADPKIISLKADIQKINRGLPAAVYVPFQGVRSYVVLNIVVDECKVFATKCRSPFYLCLEIYRPEEEAELIPNPLRNSRMSIPKTVGKMESKNSIENNETQDCTRNRPTYLCKIVEEEEEVEDSQQDLTQFSNILKDNDVSHSYYEDLNSLVSIQANSSKQLNKMSKKELADSIFGCDNSDRIRSNSPFRNFKSWKLVHLIVKSGDDLRQEQFAMQLISTFDQIFKIEQLKLQLTTYEVISLGPGYGLIEVVKDALSIDSIKKKLNDILQIKCLSSYFNLNSSQAMISNFLNSLVAYSLVCYFLQIKDRHNGNILLHRDGYIVHVDFGFFLSHAPKGSLEKDVPFKLTEEYMQILGGYNSNLFKRFRKMFFEGFKAIRKHKDKIMLLVKMMENSNLSCFKGNTLIELERRFLSNDLSDSQLYVQCQKLIDLSRGNWRANWYDKYQYYFQGIMY